MRVKVCGGMRYVHVCVGVCERETRTLFIIALPYPTFYTIVSFYSSPIETANLFQLSNNSACRQWLYLYIVLLCVPSHAKR